MALATPLAIEHCYCKSGKQLDFDSQLTIGAFKMEVWLALVFRLITVVTLSYDARGVYVLRLRMLRRGLHHVACMWVFSVRAHACFFLCCFCPLLSRSVRPLLGL